MPWSAAFREQRLQLHALGQVVGAFAATHAPARPFWLHVALRVEDDGWWTDGLGQGIRLGISRRPWRLAWTDGRGQEADVPIEGRRLEDLAHAVAEGLEGHGLTAPVSLRDPSRRPDHAVSRGDALHLGAAADDVWALYEDAQRVLAALAAATPDAQAVVLWPHGFDLSYVKVLAMGDREDGEDATTLTVGLSPGDQETPEPYWYVTSYPAAEQTRLGDAPPGGRWHTRGWTGAAMPHGEGDPAAFLPAAMAAVEEAMPTTPGRAEPVGA